MRRTCLVLAAILLTGAASAGSAQPPDRALSPVAIAIACAPPPSFDTATPQPLRVIGAQDATPRSLFGDRDLLIIGGGTSAGVELGQEFFIRRPMAFAGSRASHGATTLGWIRVVAVNESTAIGLVEHVCGGILSGDRLEPFVVPEVTAAVERAGTPGQPDFTTLGHILVGPDDRGVVGPGDYVLIDWGRNQGLASGSRFSIYRDVGIDRVPLTDIGEGVVISTSATMALTRITRARDAVYSGDYVALRR